MTHQMDDDEYRKYLAQMDLLSELKHFKERVIKSSREILTPRGNPPSSDFHVVLGAFADCFSAHPMYCVREAKENAPCDNCIPHYILGQCPFGHREEFSK